MSDLQPEPSDITYLREAMKLFHDIRKASIIIADSIRVRERCALRGTGLLTEVNVGESTAVDMADPARCPICIGEFHDPTVVSRLCGHGMHRECADRQLKSSPNSNAHMLCSICRTPYSKGDLVLLKGILPPVGNAIAWRSVYLTEPWRHEVVTPDNTSSKDSLDGCPERLLLAIRALFTCQNDFSRAIGVILRSFETVRKMAKADSNRLDDEKAALLAREHLVREAELHGSSMEVHNESVAASCAASVRNQEVSLLRSQEAIVLRQRQFQRTIEDIMFKEENLQERIRKFEKKKREHEQELKDMHEQNTNERVQLSMDEPLDSTIKRSKRARNQCEEHSQANDIQLITSSPESTGEDPASKMKRSTKRNRKL